MTGFRSQPNQAPRVHRPRLGRAPTTISPSCRNRALARWPKDSVSMPSQTPPDCLGVLSCRQPWRASATAPGFRVREACRPGSGRLVAISSSTGLLVVGVALALVLTGGATPTGVPSADPPLQLASVLDFGRSPLLLPTDGSSRAASTSTGSRPVGQRRTRTSGSRGHSTARVARKRRRTGSSDTKSKSAVDRTRPRRAT
jgi:hypothetical protein